MKLERWDFNGFCSFLHFLALCNQNIKEYTCIFLAKYVLSREEYWPLPGRLPDQVDEPPEEQDEDEGQEDVGELHCYDLSNIHTATC